MDQMIAPLVVLFAVSTLYATILRHPVAQEWTTHYTWTAVVAGVALVLGALALVDWPAAALAGLFFAVAGVPIVLGELVDDFNAKRRLMRRSMEK